MESFGQLRPVTESDLNNMRLWRNAPNVRLNMYTQHEISQEEHLAWWRNSSNSTENRYFIYELNGRSLGVVCYNKIDVISRNAAWGFYAAPDAPKGTGTMMEFLALDYAFECLRLHKLYCEVLGYNIPVIKLHRKFGFSQEGVFKEQYIFKDKYVDIYRFGMLHSDWKNLRSAMEERIVLLQRKIS
ncbi:UDP-4-amino-4,6-dideoxy-N-acetyl-beta-L-altrosamine N-acetyltransferase [Pseudomonas sp. JZ134]|uniref:UDP-4-amino-4, 6-dideoxy-N-acetyl-beta-L-altrosamine N-acetyltransferase n=1 Tax=Pseudomonas sp. JZ134 TaxID=2806615 RepID=UPI003D9FC8BA